MVWPITGAESYVRETGKSTQVRLVMFQKPQCRLVSNFLILRAQKTGAWPF